MGLKQFSRRIKQAFRQQDECSGTRIERAAHGLSRRAISENALKVLYRLKKAGFESYLVGGGVRDVLLGVTTKDYDIATSATPEEVRALFVNSRIIGRRFRLVHVTFRNETIEVSTFRAAAKAESGDGKAMLRSDNVYGNLEQDAWRRDFTVNALYYDIRDFSIVDFTGGMADLKAKVLRIIGDPAQRCHEDPVRLLRAVRFSGRLGFSLEAETEAAVRDLGHLLTNVPSSRLLHEFEKSFFTGSARQNFAALESYDYLQYFLPLTVDTLAEDQRARPLIEAALSASDQRFNDGRSLNPGFLLGVILWPTLQAFLHVEREKDQSFYQALHAAIHRVLECQQSTTAIPRRYFGIIKSMWLLQYNLERRRPKRVLSLAKHRYFRAGYDLLVLRAEQDAALLPLAQWWLTFSEADLETQETMQAELPSSGKPAAKKSAT